MKRNFLEKKKPKFLHRETHIFANRVRVEVIWKKYTYISFGGSNSEIRNADTDTLFFGRATRK